MPDRGPVATSYGLIGLPITVFVSPSGTELGRHLARFNAAPLRRHWTSLSGNPPESVDIDRYRPWARAALTATISLTEQAPVHSV